MEERWWGGKKKKKKGNQKKSDIFLWLPRVIVWHEFIKEWSRKIKTINAIINIFNCLSTKEKTVEILHDAQEQTRHS